MIVADTGAIIALIDADDRHHAALLAAWEAEPSSWVLPWAILPEVDYLLATHVAAEVARDFRRDLADGAWSVEWGTPADLGRALELDTRHADLAIGLVDSVVAAVAERLRASAIATLDVRDFGPLELAGAPRIIPRDL